VNETERLRPGTNPTLTHSALQMRRDHKTANAKPREARPVPIALVDPAHFARCFVIDPSSQCWLWQLHCFPNGYGQFHIKKKPFQAHRVAYELSIGPIPEGLVLDHTCRNRSCVNPAHLEPVTNLENCRRGARGSLTHCKRGHEFTEENTFITTQGRRRCRLCSRLRQRKGYVS
jgi:hypothetical protein